MVTVVLKFLGTQICQTHTLRQAQLLRPRMLRWVSTLDYSMDQGQKEKQLLHGMLQKKKEHFKESGQILLKDIKETRDKVKEKMEEIIERENVLTIPNLLCISRIVMSPFLGYFILQSEYHLALGLFVFAGVSDLLDGWIARNFESQASKIGSFLDPMADKVLIATLFGALTFMDLIPGRFLGDKFTLFFIAGTIISALLFVAVYLTGAIITRDLLLVAAAFCVRYKSLPPPVSTLHSNKIAVV
ncbi:hypothetical protein B7P43_G15884 [Cryptotermes secundus]|uniref:cardiolipin synthase (CMP-forming) n=1 Tax=Cryptotermes secundus TaxID=105785 RepID=A0A2J7R6M7_9NEOP|nr:hypothetical protein B7P43_G15884 [Cryptotermes secundus]PNF36488.1 hypothetical protein B7P43_G15884 [Cryptotermes secundus]